MSPYTPNQIRAAFNATVEFFRNNPDKRLKNRMSNGASASPFDDDATCFCFGGYLARELGPLPATDIEAYEPGYDELNAIATCLDYRVYEINDRAETLDEVIKGETALFIDEGLL